MVCFSLFGVFQMTCINQDLNDYVNDYYNGKSESSLIPMFCNLTRYLKAIGRKNFPHCIEIIEDCAQSTSLILLKKFREKQFDPKLSSVQTFSFLIFSRLLITNYRKIAVSNRHLDKLNSTKEKVSSDLKKSSTLSNELDVFLDKLEPLQLTLIRGKYYENKSQKILAQELGLQPSKVCKVLKTAIKNIRKQFQIHLKTR